MNKKILLVSVITLALDQISKTIVDTFLNVGNSIMVIKNVFKITYLQNTGAAWGIFGNKTWLLVIISVFMLGVIYHYMYIIKLNLRNNIAFGLLLGGTIGNLVDRILYGYVRDFFDIYIFGYNFPVFNISDICICISIGLLIIAIVRNEEVNEKNNSRNKTKKNR